MKRFHKNASLNLSINAIVVVVLAFVMLGLGLTLTRTIFTDIEGTTGQISEQIRQQILNELRSGNKPLSFPQTEVEVELRQREDVAFGIKNTGSSAATYCVAITSRPKSGDDDAPTGLEFYYDDDAQKLGASQDVVIPVTVDSGDAPQDLYRGKISVLEGPADAVGCDDTEGPDWRIHGEKSFFVTVV